MCGLVCAVGSPDPEVMGVLSASAAERGPHSHGWAWGESGEWQFDRGSGPLPAPPRAALGHQVVIGHSRLATTGSRPGDAPPSAEAQPLSIGRWVVAHNGNVPDPRSLTDEEITIDSEAIAWALLNGMSFDGLISALAGVPQALVVATGTHVWAIRVPGTHRPAHPLWSLERDGTTYLCSRGPWGAQMLPEGVTRVG